MGNVYKDGLSKGGQIVLKFLKKHKDTPKRTLAKMIYTQYPEMFKSVEQIRVMIRSYTGANGKRETKSVIKEHPELQKDKRVKKNEIFNYVAPDSIARTIDPYYLPVNSRVLFIPDIHFPYHNPKALELALKYGKEHKCNVVVMQESFDYYHHSRFEKDPQEVSFKIQREMYLKFLEGLRKFFGNKVTIIEQNSNHTQRWQKWLRMKTPELDGIEYFGLENVFQFDKYKIHFVDTHIKAGKLNIVHGHEFMGGGGTFPAKWLYEKTKQSTMCGHFHRTSEYTEVNAFDRDNCTCWSVACLATTQPDYMKYGKHNNGFAFIYIQKDGNFEVKNKRIIGNKIV